MTATGVGHIRHLSFLTPGNFEDDHPWDGLEATLRLFEHGEREGWDGAWIRQRHLEHGVGSAAVFLAAASQRTSRIELGTAVIPVGWESPFRLAEDLSLADVLSRGRLQAGFSTGQPHADLIGDLVFDGDWRSFDFSHRRVERIVDNVRGDFLGGPDAVIHSPGNVQRPRLQPHAKGLADRLWYGAGSVASAAWAGSIGLNLLSGNVQIGRGETDFFRHQGDLLDAYAEASGGDLRQRRVAIGRVIVPLDSATPAQREHYLAYRDSRLERQERPQGEHGILFAPDYVGTAEQIAEWLAEDPVVARTTELRVELPYEFSLGEYEQILHDVRHVLAPRLGWEPSA